MIIYVNHLFFQGFAAACTAAILLPLDWLMGIRLAKEDEIVGLDAAGRCHRSIYGKNDYL